MLFVTVIFSWLSICCHSFPWHLFHISSNFCYFIFLAVCHISGGSYLQAQGFQPISRVTVRRDSTCSMYIHDMFFCLVLTGESISLEQNLHVFPFAISIPKDYNFFICLLCIIFLLRLASRPSYIGYHVDYPEQGFIRQAFLIYAISKVLLPSLPLASGCCNLLYLLPKALSQIIQNMTRN